MVGRVVKPHYRRRRNLLSHFDYRPVLENLQSDTRPRDSGFRYGSISCLRRSSK